jgi:hypothetical protein
LYHFILEKYVTWSSYQLKYLLFILCIVNYPVYLIMKSISYNEGVRYLLRGIRDVFIKAWWMSKHVADKASYSFSLVKIRCGNGMSRISAKIKTSFSRTHAKLSNQTMPRLMGDPVKVPGSPGYVEAVQYNPEIDADPQIRTWEQKMFDRLASAEAIQNSKIANTVYFLKCIKNKLTVDFASNSTVFAPAKAEFWANRYDKVMANNNLPLYRDLPVLHVSKLFNIQSYEHNSIMPEPGQSAEVYFATRNSFDKYINHLNTIRTNLQSKKLEVVNQQIADANIFGL